jgi:hypothetical protein
MKPAWSDVGAGCSAFVPTERGFRRACESVTWTLCVPSEEIVNLPPP